ncbi:hypothetical protein BS645_08260 [Pseudomonas protegens]|uniref:hypothetical protein n=1 Tax=Pseudomonas protegens TaxID=380021 RepID=UPI000806FF4C|nr:hypothetical protein [Pseudomonas protegens]OBZ25447.1 hypothetical protein BBH58_08195 [Pseudomonas protegens]OBZ31440.1 hypothetical protein BBH57_16545 [Pseudomonas protegens]OKK42763.1 hypothetical protein BS644_19565 [Pseudomonas protegens]OKK61420.1 hypothetical protein BS645_08260 [Pseudomonas protegens]OKK65955.1 hypothetical protein BS646_18915 [Pseudomonas protegens]
MFKEDETGEKETAGTGFLTLGRIRDILLIAFVGVVSYKFASAEFNVDLKDFSFTDLLSLFLAIASVALSAAFYFKADESARSFYTHTYKFTNDVSEMLGRIEAGFGEKLRSIDQGYIGLNQKFDNFRFAPPSGTAGLDQSEEKKAEIQEQEARRDNIIEDLMRRADIAGAEKEELLARLNSLTEELERSKVELEAKSKAASHVFDFDGSFADFLRPLVFRYYGGYRSKAYSEEFVKKVFTRVLSDDDFQSDAYGYMQRAGLLDGPRLTSKGVSFVTAILKGDV